LFFFGYIVVYPHHFSGFRREKQEADMPQGKRIQVRAENPSGACGKLDHMTIDELKARAVGDDFDGTCPACGKFHLTRAEIEKIEQEKVTQSESYKQMKEEVEAS
jgi:hypothetical protein